MLKIFTSCLTFLLFPFLLYAQPAFGPATAPYAAGIVVFKLKGEELPPLSAASARTARGLQEQAKALAASVGAKELVQPFASLGMQKKGMKSARQTENNPLSSLYKLELQPGQQVEEVIRQLQSSKLVEYAEPYYLPQLLQQPDDEFFDQQEHLTNIKASLAWSISQGSRDVVIGILDTGVDLNHPDLKHNLYLNEADPIDGIDNDSDGFTDNYHGWDFANNDNNPSADKSGHGTIVTGFSSASTNNDIGIAGTGYNCRYMPIKIFRSEDNRFRNGYEAMVYAAEMGCDVLNLSWGAPGLPSQYVQDIINYLVLEKNVVIVAAAGNDAKELNFYPASYENVLSVSSSDYTDAKAAYATWSRFVDLLAPGKDVFSTTNGGGYGNGTGTSFASPQVAGAAALVRSYFPELNALQVMERLRVSSDSVDDSAFPEKIGKGRLNMEKALSRTVSPAVRMQQFNIFNGTGPFAFYNDTVEVRMDLINFLSATTKLKLTLSTESPYVTFIDSEVSPGTINTLGTYKNEATPFRFYLHPNLPSNEVITFRIGYSDINYEDYQYFQLRTSGSYFDFASDQLSLTVSSEGNLGYNYNFNLQGSGFRFQKAPLAHNLGLVLAQSSKAVATNTMYNISPAERYLDFRPLERLKLFTNSTASRDARSAYETIVSENVPLNIRVEQKILGWEDTLASAAMVIEYRFINKADTAYEQLHTGIFTDFDINEFFRNKGGWDTATKIGYAYDYEQNRYAGMALLSSHAPSFHALDIATRNGNTSELADSLSRADLYTYLSGGIGKQTAGVEGNGTDVAQFLGGTIPLLQSKGSEKVAFALLTASSLDGLKKAAEEVQKKYLHYLQTPPLNSRLLACPGSQLEVNPANGERFQFYSDPYGQELIAEGSTIILENLTTDTTFYVANTDNEFPGDIERIELMLKAPLAQFSMSTDTLSIEAGETGMVQLTDKSEFPAEWYWNFNNGYQSIQQSPKAYFNTPGTYTIELVMTNIAGCSDTLNKQLVVVQRNAPPVIDNQLLCEPGKAILLTADGTPFHLYADEGSKMKIFSGTVFETAQLTKDTTFYASSGQGAYESRSIAVSIEVFSADINLRYSIDTLAEAHQALQFKATVQQAEELARIDWFVNGVLAQQGEQLHWSYTEEDESISLQVYAYYRNGCQASVSEEVMLEKSPLPLLASQELCKGETALLRPQDDGIYYFYYNAEKDSLLKKGREYLLEPVQASHTYFVTNISLGQESEALSVDVNIPEGLADFTLSADTIFLHSGEAVLCQSTHTEVSEWLWNFGNGITSSLPAPEHPYKNAGTYTISLRAKNQKGCTEVASKTLVVMQNTATGEEKSAASGLGVYPNPAKEQLQIQVPEISGKSVLHLQDASGKLIKTYSVNAGQSLFELSVQALPQGLYWLRLQTEKGTYTSRFTRQ
ncbi:S8 family serine peptidase [Nafulsella turpanensis]|uniref:S8 family serine peptidase n=1 Tax=Nafulsella turpanensis TaxID=1265690 RepID=UPI00034952F6|nr:S8 family serine peptidase [Nafulsella turpanensis]